LKSADGGLTQVDVKGFDIQYKLEYGELSDYATLHIRGDAVDIPVYDPNGEFYNTHEGEISGSSFMLSVGHDIFASGAEDMNAVKLEKSPPGYVSLSTEDVLGDINLSSLEGMLGKLSFSFMPMDSNNLTYAAGQELQGSVEARLTEGSIFSVSIVNSSEHEQALLVQQVLSTGGSM
jgi:hypothetical protein